jgi:alpha-N-acetylglucosaminidase
MQDMDELLATREEFLLGRWLADARSWGDREEQKRHYEWNARTQITLWGPEEGVLHDYAAKQWSGLISGFYLPRWRMFFERLDKSLENGVTFDAESFEKDIRKWEAEWGRLSEPYPDKPQGDTLAVVRRLWEKYQALAITEWSREDSVTSVQ